jgi:uncharacterized OsmC-like protein
MDERVIVRQNKRYETNFYAVDPDGIDPDQYQEIQHIHELTPYGMLLVSVGSCTAIVLHSYAQRNRIPLDEVELRLEFGRNFKEDCDNCEGQDRYEDHIIEKITFIGKLTDDQIEKLQKIAHFCPIHQMFTKGIPIQTIFKTIEDEGTATRTN